MLEILCLKVTVWHNIYFKDASVDYLLLHIHFCVVNASPFNI